MAAGRSLKSLLSRRRRADEEGEDEEGPVAVEDSQSEGSVLSEPANDEVDTSTLGGGEESAVGGAMDATDVQAEVAANGSSSINKKMRKDKKQNSRKRDTDVGADPTQTLSQSSNFKITADTEAMVNGLRIADPSEPQTAVGFNDSDIVPRNTASSTPASLPTAPVPFNGSSEIPPTRNRRDHEEYRRKRDADPAFIPNKGNFFMHDTRTSGDRGSLQSRGGWNGRGRGRGGANVGGSFSPANPVPPAERAAGQPWKHDLHDTINEETAPFAPSRPADALQNQEDSARGLPRAGSTSQSQRAPVLNFSRTTLEGTIQIRVSLPGMKAPIIFSEVPWKKYTRLPDHRPPLRRDKPVRISIAGHTQRYIFPSSDRSFIFIPRQMRPNQQGFGRSGYQRSVGGYGSSSRRTSMYGGSMYANSVAASRRSSFASITRDSAFSPVGSYGGHMPPNRPIVRLPHGSQSHFSSPTTPMGPLSGYQTPTGYHVHTYPLPQQPAFQGTPTTTMHQPRPQKAISVTGIESPAAALQQHAPAPSDSQPFQNQLPAHMIEQPAYNQPPQGLFLPQQQFQFAQQQPAASPLSGIPEQAVHAAAFQPPNMPFEPAAYYNSYQQQGYYYPPGAAGYQPMPIYVPPAQGFAMPPPTAALPPPHAPPQPTSSQPIDPDQQSQPLPRPQPQSGIVAEERNGMVFYRRAAEAQQESQGEAFQPAESFVPQYAMPGLPPPTPAPETAYYYPHMSGMPDVAPSGYYPGQSQQPQ